MPGRPATSGQIERAMDDILARPFFDNRPNHKKILQHLAKAPNVLVRQEDVSKLMTGKITPENRRRIRHEVREHLRDCTEGGITYRGPPAITLELMPGRWELRATIVPTAPPPSPDLSPPPSLPDLPPRPQWPNAPRPLWLWILGGCLVVALILIVVWRETSGPPAIELKLISPGQGAHVGRTGNVVVEASPDVRAVYVLVYPQEAVTKVWWVQRPLVEKDGIPGRWEGEVFYGESDLGTEQKFTIVAQGTNEGWLLRIIRGAYLTEGEQLVIPSLRLKASDGRPTVKRIE